MGKVAPLKHFPLFTSSNTAEAEQAIRRSLSDVTVLKVDSASNFHVQMNGVELGKASIVYNSFRSETRLKAGLPEDYVYLIFSGDQPSIFHLDRQQVTVSQSSAALIMPEMLTGIERSAGSEVLVVRLPRPDVQHHLESLTGRHHSGAVSFESSVNLQHGDGAIVDRLFDFIVQEVNHDDPARTNPIYVKALYQMVLSAILSLPNNKSAQLRAEGSSTTAPGMVRRVEEYLRANLQEMICITDLLEVSDCSRSALFAAFKNARQYTPMEFLTEQRLQHARENLLQPQVSDTVSSIAVRSGFVNLGRFSQQYHKRFGERPSSTLMKSLEK